MFLVCASHFSASISIPPQVLNQNRRIVRRNGFVPTVFRVFFAIRPAELPAPLAAPEKKFTAAALMAEPAARGSVRMENNDGIAKSYTLESRSYATFTRTNPTTIKSGTVTHQGSRFNAERKPPPRARPPELTLTVIESLIESPPESRTG